MPPTVIADDVEYPVRPAGRFHAYCVALDTPVIVTVAESADEQYVTVGIVPPVGVAK